MLLILSVYSRAQNIWERERPLWRDARAVRLLNLRQRIPFGMAKTNIDGVSSPATPAPHHATRARTHACRAAYIVAWRGNVRGAGRTRLWWHRSDVAEGEVCRFELDARQAWMATAEQMNMWCALMV